MYRSQDEQQKSEIYITNTRLRIIRCAILLKLYLHLVFVRPSRVG